MLSAFSSLKQHVSSRLHTLQERVLRWLKPPTTSLVLGTFADLTRRRADLLAENALLRQQLIVLHRQIKRPVYRKADRLLLVILDRGGSDLETGPLPCPAGDITALAS